MKMFLLFFRLYRCSYLLYVSFLNKKLRNTMYSVKYEHVTTIIGLFDNDNNFLCYYDKNNEEKHNFIVRNYNSNEIKYENLQIFRFSIPLFLTNISGVLNKHFLSENNEKKPFCLEKISSFNNFNIFRLLLSREKKFEINFCENTFIDILQLLDFFLIKDDIQNRFFYLNFIRNFLSNRAHAPITCSIKTNLIIRNITNHLHILCNLLFNINDINNIIAKNNIDSIFLKSYINRKYKSIFVDNDSLVINENNLVQILNEYENIKFRCLFKFIIVLLKIEKIKILAEKITSGKYSSIIGINDIFIAKTLIFDGNDVYKIIPLVLFGKEENNIQILQIIGTTITERVVFSLLKLKNIHSITILSSTIKENLLFFNKDLKTNLRYLDLSRSKIMPKDILKIGNLTELTQIVFNDSFFKDGSFSCLKNARFQYKLKNLELRNLCLSSEDFNTILLFQNLEYLDLCGTKIIFNNGYSYRSSNFQRLQHINILGVNLNKVILDVLNSIQNTKHLILSTTHPESILFPDILYKNSNSTLLTLKLGYNRLSYTELKLISKLQALYELHLNKTNLNDSDLEVFKESNLTESLRILVLNRNHITEAGMLFFQNYNYLEDLDISLCNIKNLDFLNNKSFLSNLTKLNLGRNLLGNIDLRILGQLEKLKFLDLSLNDIKGGRVSTLKNTLLASTLEVLFYIENELNHIDIQTFETFHSLKHLNINKAKIVRNTFFDLAKFSLSLHTGIIFRISFRNLTENILVVEYLEIDKEDEDANIL